MIRDLRGPEGQRGTEEAPAARPVRDREVAGAALRLRTARRPASRGTSGSGARSRTRSRFTWDEFQPAATQVGPHRHPLRDPLDAGSTRTGRASRSSTSSSAPSSGRRPTSCVAHCGAGLHRQPAARRCSTTTTCCSPTSPTARRSTPDHGYPLRLFVPKRYFWKSAKWIRGLAVPAAGPARLLGALRLQQQRRSLEGRALQRRLRPISLILRLPTRVAGGARGDRLASESDGDPVRARARRAHGDVRHFARDRRHDPEVPLRFRSNPREHPHPARLVDARAPRGPLHAASPRHRLHPRQPGRAVDLEKLPRGCGCRR